MGKKVVFFVIPVICAILYLTVSFVPLSELMQALASNKALFPILLCILVFCLLHLVKMLRYYLILSETGIGLKDFISIYLKSALVNIIIPFKLGELYRFCLVSNKIKSWPTALLSILTERFYDTAVVALILGVQAILLKEVSFRVLVLFATFVFIVFIAYTAFPTTATYLNRFFIFRRQSNQDISFLHALNTMEKWYGYEQKMVRGRGQVVFLLSMLSWITEYFFFAVLSKAIQIPFNFTVFTRYISGVLFTDTSFPHQFILFYSVVSIVVFYTGYFVLWKYRKKSQCR